MNAEEKAEKAKDLLFNIIADKGYPTRSDTELIVDFIIQAAVEEAINKTPQPDPWECPECGHLNKAGMHYCEFCKQLDEDEGSQPEELGSVGFEDTAANIISWLLNMYDHHDAWEGGNEAKRLMEAAVQRLGEAHQLYASPEPEDPQPIVNPFRHLSNQQLVDIIRKIPDKGPNPEAKATIQAEWEMTRDLIADHLASCQFSQLVEFIGLAAPHMEYDIYNFRSRLAEILDLIEEKKLVYVSGPLNWKDAVEVERKQEEEWNKNNRIIGY